MNNHISRLDRGLSERARQILHELELLEPLTVITLGPVHLELLRERLVTYIKAGPGYELRLSSFGRKVESYIADRDLRIGGAEVE